MNASSAPNYFFRAWRSIVLLLSLALLGYLLYFHNIAHLLPGYSAREIQNYQAASNWHSIATNPLNAPYKLVVWLAVALGHHSILITRVVSAIFGLFAALIFFVIVRPWYGFRVAFLGTIVFATSAGFLHIARLGSAQILQMSVLVLMGVLLWYRRAPKRPYIVSYIIVAIFAGLWYIPGMIWFEILGLVLLRKGLLRQLRNTSYLHLGLWAALCLALAAPLIVASVHMPSLWLRVLGLPTSLSTLSHTGTNLWQNLLAIGVRSNGNAELWVGHAPLLNIIELGLGVIGVYYYVLQERSARSIFLVGATILALILSSVGGSATFAALVPLLYIFVAGGIAQLLGQWLRVFPRNPIARFTGTAIVCTMLAFSVLYQVRSYFVAWPHDIETHQTFNHPQPQ